VSRAQEDKESYCELLERFRDLAESRGVKFQAAMREALAAWMHERPKFAKGDGRRIRKTDGMQRAIDNGQLTTKKRKKPHA
jgi:hypothetical protein